jgi:hypothetical protein
MSPALFFDIDNCYAGIGWTDELTLARSLAAVV